jgi:hypothetical protein
MTLPGTVQAYTQQQLAQIIGRNQGPEFFYAQTVQTLQSPILSKNLNLTRPLERMVAVLRMRVVISGHDYDAVSAEAPQNFLQRLRIYGTHQTYGSLAPVDMSGASLFQLLRYFRNHASSVYISKNGGPSTRQPDPGTPYQQVLSTFGSVGTYDIKVFYDVPVGPIVATAVKNSAVPFMWQPADWSDTLQIQPYFGDPTSFGTPDSLTTVDLYAYGQNSGNPTLEFYTNYEILGPLANQIAAAVVVRSSQNIINPLTSVSAAPVQLVILQKQKTTNVFIKTGEVLQGSSPGVTVFATLDDTILEQTQPIVDNKPIRNNYRNDVMEEYVANAFDTEHMEGSLLFTFVDSQNPLTYYRGDKVPAGSTFAINTQVANAPANAMAEIVQEQVYGNPKAGTSSSSQTAGTAAVSS